MRKNYKKNQVAKPAEATEKRIVCFTYTFSSAAAQIDILEFMKYYPNPLGKEQISAYLGEMDYHFDSSLFDITFNHILDSGLLMCVVQKLGLESSKLYSITRQGIDFLDKYECSEFADYQARECVDFGLVGDDLSMAVLYLLRCAIKPISDRSIYLMARDNMRDAGTLVDVRKFLYQYKNQGFVHYSNDKYSITKKGRSYINSMLGEREVYKAKI